MRNISRFIQYRVTEARRLATKVREETLDLNGQHRRKQENCRSVSSMLEREPSLQRMRPMRQISTELEPYPAHFICSCHFDFCEKYKSGAKSLMMRRGLSYDSIDQPQPV